jgi:hypothetical protein
MSASVEPQKKNALEHGSPTGKRQWQDSSSRNGRRWVDGIFSSSELVEAIVLCVVAVLRRGCGEGAGIPRRNSLPRMAPREVPRAWAHREAERPWLCSRHSEAIRSSVQCCAIFGDPPSSLAAPLLEAEQSTAPDSAGLVVAEPLGPAPKRGRASSCIARWHHR